MEHDFIIYFEYIYFVNATFPLFASYNMLHKHVYRDEPVCKVDELPHAFSGNFSNKTDLSSWISPHIRYIVQLLGNSVSLGMFAK